MAFGRLFPSKKSTSADEQNHVQVGRRKILVSGSALAGAALLGASTDAQAHPEV